MVTQPRAQLAQLLDELQANLPMVLASGPIEAQCRLVVERAADILHQTRSLDRDYVSDRLAWILARLPPCEKNPGQVVLDSIAATDPVAIRRRLGLYARQAVAV